MKESKFPTLQEALYLHAELINRFGGSHGLLDRGLLESALARPRSGYYRSLSEQAAALLHSLINNHCFVDGNKRIAFALTAAFLLMNGFVIKIGAHPAEKFILGLASGSKEGIEPIVRWLEKHMEKVTKER